MNLADVFTVVLVIAGVLGYFLAVWLLARGLWPARVARCADALGAAPWACLGTGLLLAGPGIGAGVLLGRLVPGPGGRLIAALVLLSVVLLALAGAAGLALLIGRGLAAERDVAEPWRQVLRGGVVLALVQLTLLPLPFTLFLGAGAWWRARRGVPPEAS